MFSSRLVSLSHTGIALLLITNMMQMVSATPTDHNPADVVSENRIMACTGRSCYIKNDTVTTDTVASPSALFPIPTTQASANGAVSSQQPAVVLPAVIGASFLLL